MRSDLVSPGTNSTIGRSIIDWLTRLAPERAERRVAEAFARPRRFPAPLVPIAGDLRARPFQLTSGAYRLSAWAWGEHGAEPRPTILLVHGWNGAAAQMTAFVPPLVRSGFRVVAFDLPAHGGSSGARATLVDLARAVRDVADAAGPVDGVVAHSLGATATALAIADGLAPARAALIAPPAEMPYFVTAFARALGLPDSRLPAVLEHIRRDIGGDLDRFDLRRLAPSLRVPALLLHDPEDREVPFAHGAAIAEAWPNAKLLPLRRVGHTRALTDLAVIDTVTAYLDRAERPSRATLAS
jgi:pimeloyl-ACP methyl ester carboxylesterase